MGSGDKMLKMSSGISIKEVFGDIIQNSFVKEE